MLYVHSFSIVVNTGFSGLRFKALGLSSLGLFDSKSNRCGGYLSVIYSFGISKPRLIGYLRLRNPGFTCLRSEA